MSEDWLDYFLRHWREDCATADKRQPEVRMMSFAEVHDAIGPIAPPPEKLVEMYRKYGPREATP